MALGFPVVEFTEDEEDDSVFSYKSRKSRSILRPRINKASKKFMGRHQTIRADTKEEAYQEEDVESPYAVEGTQKAPTMVTSAGNGPGLKISLQASIWSSRAGEPLPSYYKPRGRGNAWTCPYDGCVHQVWDAGQAASLDMIKSHFAKTHAGSAEHLINKESRPWISVDHLLERVKGIASLQPPRQVGLPPRIVRRY
ncbi:hypothetical protein MMC13_007484 [Lambiella insularis]|nr:hypothetical protein [Lambiella insularis]